MVIAGASVLLVGGSAAFGVTAFASYRQGTTAASDVRTTTTTTVGTEPRIVFRNTALGEGYGLVATVPLDHPGGARSLTEVACDRVYATNDKEMCLRTNRGIVTSFTASLLDSA